MFIPENALEERLVAATTDPAARPDFYRELVRSKLFIINEGAIPPREETRLTTEGERLAIRPVELDGRTYLPVFSSLTRLRAVLDREVGYLALDALTFFEITRGADLVLNYGSQYGKALLADEVASIVDGSIFEPAARIRVGQETEVLIGHPAEPPVALMDVLRRVFSRHPAVRHAFVAIYGTRDEEPHTLIAIDADGEADWDRIIGDAMIAMGGVAVPKPPVDFIRLNGSGVESHFRAPGSTPFYTRG